MNARTTVVLVFAFALVFVAQATNTPPTQITVEGVTYTDVRWGSLQGDKITIYHSTGVATLSADSLPKEVRQELGYEEDNVKQESQEAARTVAAQEQKPVAAKPEFVPNGAIPFKYEEFDVLKGIVQRIEFDKEKCNLTLKNRTDETIGYDQVTVSVLNKDGAVIWHAETSNSQSLAPGEKATFSWGWNPAMPVELRFSKYARDFDPTPKWIMIEVKK